MPALTRGEHLFFHGAVANSFVSLAAAAGATSRIRLLLSVTILPLYPAVLAAKLATTLDQVSGGRFDFGVGVGGEFPDEFTAAGVSVRTHGRRNDEHLEVLRRFWSGGQVNFDGEFTSIPNLALDPPPLQPGGPPIWLGGRKPAAMRRAAQFALRPGWQPHIVRSTAGQFRRAPEALHGAIFCWGTPPAAAMMRTRARKTAAAPAPRST